MRGPSSTPARLDASAGTTYCVPVRVQEQEVPIETTYTAARANLAKLLDSAVEDREIVLIRRRGAKDVALIAADELESLLETAHLLRSPRNAERLLRALQRARARTEAPQQVGDLRSELGLDSQG